MVCVTEFASGTDSFAVRVHAVRPVPVEPGLNGIPVRFSYAVGNPSKGIEIVNALISGTLYRNTLESLALLPVGCKYAGPDRERVTCRGDHRRTIRARVDVVRR